MAIDVVNVSAPNQDGIYQAGDLIEIGVTFNGPVNSVVGTPQLRLSSGSNAFAQFDPVATGALPSNTLKFTYRITAGENSDDLDYAAANALELGTAPNGILDDFGAPAALTLPVPGGVKSLGWNQNIAVDTSAPYATITISKLAVGNANNTATVYFTLNEPSSNFVVGDIAVTTAGAPLLGTLSNFRGTGKTYAVDFTPPPAFVGVVMFDVPAGSFTDAAGNANVVVPGTSAQLVVDTNAPVVRQVTSSSPNGSSNAVGTAIDIKVEFSTPVAVGGLGLEGFPYLELNSGTGARAEYVSVMGSVITFRYELDENEEASDLDYRSVDALRGGYILNLNGGTPALRTLPVPGEVGSLAANKNLSVDTRGPTLAITSNRYLLGSGQTALITFTLSEPADPAAPFDLSDVGIFPSTAGNLSFWTPAGQRTYTAVFTPEPNFSGSVAFAVDAKVFKDVAGNDNSSASLSVPIVINTTSPGTPTIDTQVTKNTSPTIGGTTGASPLGPDQRLVVALNGVIYDTRGGAAGVQTVGNAWSLNLATAVPRLGVWAPLTDGTYEVTATIIDDAGNQKPDASSDELKIDTIAPTVVSVTSIDLDSPPSYGLGKTITIEVVFSEDVDVLGSPSLKLNSGVGALGKYDPINSTATVKRFIYTVGGGEATPDLDYSSINSLELNGGTFRDAALNDANLTLPAPGASGSLGASKQIVVETTAPVATITASKNNLKIGDTAEITITFPEPVTGLAFSDFAVVGGSIASSLSQTGPSTYKVLFTPSPSYEGVGSVTLPAGVCQDLATNPNAVSSLLPLLSIDTVAPPTPSISALTTNQTLPTLSGTVSTALRAGETLNVTINDANGTIVGSYPVVPLGTAWSLNLATVSPPLTPLADGIYSVSAITGDSGGNTASATGSFTIDTVNAKVLAVSSSTANGTYGVGTVISIDVYFNEKISLDPNKSATPRLKLNSGGFADYTTGDGSSKWTFTYTVAKGESTTDLDYAGTNALELNGAGLVDAAGNPVDPTLAAPGATGSLGASNAIVIETTSPTATITADKKSLKIGETAVITIIFSEPVTGLSLQDFVAVGGTLSTTYGLKQTGPSTYEVIFTPDASYEGVGSVTLPAGVCQDLATNPNAVASLATSLQIDTKAPSVVITSDLAAGASITAGKNLRVTFVWTENVTGFTDAKVLVSNLVLVPNSWTSIGTNAYVADYTPTASFEGNATVNVLAGVTTDVAGNGNVANQFVAAIDTKSPIVAITANPVAIKSSGTSIVTFTFSSSPTGFDATDVVYDATKGSLGPITGSGTTWTAVFTPSPTYIGEIAISIGAGAFTDANGNPNTAGASTTVTVDMVAPRVLSVSAPAGFYNADDVVTIAVLFSEPLFGDLAKLTLGLNSVAADVSRVATWSATDSVDNRIQLFSYRVADGDNARPLDYVTVNSLTGGPVTDLAGNTASLTLPTPGQGGALASSNVVIDTLAPTIVNVRANKTNVALKADDRIRIDLEFSEPLPYTPTALPDVNLVLNNGGVASSWTMIGDRTIRLIYKVQPGENANPLDYFTVDALMIQPAIRNGVVTDFAGNTANLKLAAPGDARSLSRNSTVIVDTEAPKLLGIRADKPDGSYTTPTVITLRAQFNESVKVDPALPWPRLRLALPGERYATFDRVEGNDVLFRYEILPGDNTPRLDYFSTSALTGTVKDLVGNDANLTLPSPGSTGSLSDDQAIVIDTTAPRVSGVSLASAPGEYGPDSTIRFAVTMTEAVRVSGVPTIQLNTTPAGSASFASQSGDGRVLFFEYRPAMGDLASVLNPASALALAGGITDVAGNAAVLTLPTPVAQQSFGGPGVVAVDARIKVIGASSGISPTQPGPVFVAPLTTIDLQFNVPVTGVTLAALSVTYQGRPLSLAGASITGSGSTYRLTLPSTLTNLKGQYRLRIGGLASGIRAISNGVMMSPASNLYWQRVAAPKK